mmetsp:Transcript_39326/g.75346  ORF Transcript_39326/g.75346 Transcript_39326/m.75346 type:complete len:257 (-) Transcript_39326:1816-2586(-)
MHVHMVSLLPFISSSCQLYSWLGNPATSKVQGCVNHCSHVDAKIGLEGLSVFCIHFVVNFWPKLVFSAMVGALDFPIAAGASIKAEAPCWVPAAREAGLAACSRNVACRRCLASGGRLSTVRRKLAGWEDASFVTTCTEAETSAGKEDARSVGSAATRITSPKIAAITTSCAEASGSANDTASTNILRTHPTSAVAAPSNPRPDWLLFSTSPVANTAAWGRVSATHVRAQAYLPPLGCSCAPASMAPRREEATEDA